MVLSKSTANDFREPVEGDTHKVAKTTSLDEDKNKA